MSDLRLPCMNSTIAEGKILFRDLVSVEVNSAAKFVRVPCCDHCGEEHKYTFDFLMDSTLNCITPDLMRRALVELE